MKFWELITAFRDEKQILEVVLNDSKWKDYKASYTSLEKIIADQNRKVLDEEIPYELASQVCFKSNKRFWFYPARNPQLLSGFQLSPPNNYNIAHSCFRHKKHSTVESNFHNDDKNY